MGPQMGVAGRGEGQRGPGGGLGRCLGAQALTWSRDWFPAEFLWGKSQIHFLKEKLRMREFMGFLTLVTADSNGWFLIT